jgi:hypothetical protein
MNDKKLDKIYKAVFLRRQLNWDLKGIAIYLSREYREKTTQKQVKAWLNQYTEHRLRNMGQLNRGCA